MVKDGTMCSTECGSGVQLCSRPPASGPQPPGPRLLWSLDQEEACRGRGAVGSSITGGLQGVHLFSGGAPHHTPRPSAAAALTWATPSPAGFWSPQGCCWAHGSQFPCSCQETPWARIPRPPQLQGRPWEGLGGRGSAGQLSERLWSECRAGEGPCPSLSSRERRRNALGTQFPKRSYDKGMVHGDAPRSVTSSQGARGTFGLGFPSGTLGGICSGTVTRQPLL